MNVKIVDSQYGIVVLYESERIKIVHEWDVRVFFADNSREKFQILQIKKIHFSHHNAGDYFIRHTKGWLVKRINI